MVERAFGAINAADRPNNISVTNIEKIEVATASRPYPVLVGDGLLERPGILDQWLGGGGVLAVTSRTVADLYLERIPVLLEVPRCESVILPDGEEAKDANHWQRILRRMARLGLGRDCTLLALGGGCVGDVAGFAAACYHRGVDYVQLPTTLLAQVDSSVGGKTAINTDWGKNLLGAFHQPRAVLCDTGVLRTLPDREYAAGLAEVVKYGMIADSSFFDWLESNSRPLLARDAGSLRHAVRRSVELKARIVGEDEHDLSGQRAVLNFGHTFAHAIEHSAGYGEWLHGEAVAAGMCMAAMLAVREGGLKVADRKRLEALLATFGLPIRAKGFGAETLKQAMLADKKNLHGTIRLVLPDGLGRARLTGDFSHESLDAVLAGRAP